MKVSPLQPHTSAHFLISSISARPSTQSALPTTVSSKLAASFSAGLAQELKEAPQGLFSRARMIVMLDAIKSALLTSEDLAAQLPDLLIAAGGLLEEETAPEIQLFYGSTLDACAT